jgi:ATP-dependent RNA helicase DeaD
VTNRRRTGKVEHEAPRRIPVARARQVGQNDQMPSARNTSPKDGFPALGLSEALVATITALGYEEPTPVQRETIPFMLAGRDLLAQAATGTGKTAAFALPMIQRLTEPVEPTGREAKTLIRETAPAADDVSRRAAGFLDDRPRLTGRKKPTASGRTAGMVLVPTRELAMQVCEAIHKYARGTSLTVVPLYGGASMLQQIRGLDRGADIVVATPGRALDHIRRKTLALDALRILVLDEADEMLDMGFAEDLEAIFAEMPATRQTTLFSATLPSRILRIAERHLTTPQRVTVAREKTASGKLPRVRQVAYVVRHGEKSAALDRILDMESPTSAIVFCRTRLAVDTLVETLNAHGYRAEALHGGMQQRQRDAVMQRVRSNTTDLLIATDVAARGLDIEHVSHVVNYDLPADAESYVHRIGRTGRAGREGTAITLAEPREHRLLRSIEQLTKQKIDVATVPTVADLRARRLETTSTALRERLTKGDFDDVRVVVESLSDEFDVVDIAAAAVKMAHLATIGDGDEQEIASPPPPSARPREGSSEGRAPGGRPSASRRERPEPGGDLARLFIGAGRTAGIRPADLVGAIAGEAGVPSSVIGSIRIAENFSVVEVPEDLVDRIIASMRGASLRGKKALVRRDRDTPR